MKKHWNEVYDKTNEIMEKVCDETGAEWEEINQKSIGLNSQNILKKKNGKNFLKILKNSLNHNQFHKKFVKNIYSQNSLSKNKKTLRYMFTTICFWVYILKGVFYEFNNTSKKKL